MPRIDEIKRSIKTKIEDDFKKSFKVPPGQDLPGDVKNMVSDATDEAFTSLIKNSVRRSAITLSKENLRVTDIQTAISGRLANASKGVKLVSGSPELQAILDENARMLFAKKTALVNAGFSNDEAFQLILAEVSAKKSR